MPAACDLQVYAGDTWSQSFTFRAKNGTALVLPTTGWTAQARYTREAAGVLTTFTVDASAGALGQITLSLPAAVTATLPSCVWDLQQKSGDAVRTWLAGRLLVTGDVTRV